MICKSEKDTFPERQPSASLPVRDIFQRFFPEYEKENPSIPEHKYSTAHLIMMCKTGDLGYTSSYCEDCKRIFIHNTSCNNRSCPNCQQLKEKQWTAERNAELIDGIAYYHVVFTVPHELNNLFLSNEKVMYRLLFQSAQQALLALCRDPKFLGATPGILSVLHTWGQKLNYHPHLHVCLSGGGLTPQGTFIEAKHKGFIIPEKVLAASFRGRFLCGLKKLYEQGSLSFMRCHEIEEARDWQDFIDTLFKKQWIPFLKETFNGHGNAIKYLARYAYRTAIANSRIVSIDDETVTIRYKDYADGDKSKLLTLKGSEFVKLFLLHILPSGFTRIRYSGYLTNRWKTRNLKTIHYLRNSPCPINRVRKMKTRDLMLRFYGKDISRCPCCNGHLLLLEQKRGSPQKPCRRPLPTELYAVS
jgi:hypothetical protein